MSDELPNPAEISSAAAPTEPVNTGSMESEMAATYEKVQSRPSEYEAKQPSEKSSAPVEQPQQISKAIDPTFLPKHLRQHWDSSHQELQKWIADREAHTHAEFARRGSELADLRKSGDRVTELDNLYKEYDHAIPRINGQPLAQNDAFRLLLNAHVKLQTDPVNSIRHLMQNYNVDPRQLGGQAPDREIAQMREAMQQERQQFQTAQLQEQQRRETYLMQSLEKFADGKDHWKDPGFEDEVYRQVVAMRMENPGSVFSDPIGTLKIAEERAMKIAGVQDKAAVAEHKAELMRKVTDAKRMISINVRSAAGTSPGARQRNLSRAGEMEDFMGQVYDRVAGR